jgi:acetyl esterase/lipase
MKYLAFLVGLVALHGFAQTTQPDLQHPPVNPEFIALPHAEAGPQIIEHKNITYLHASGADLQLDVYQQPGKTSAPVIVYFHGGAWWKNARPATANGFRSLLSLGFTLVTVDYRLTGVAPAPASVQDARCSLAWVKRNAAQYNFDLNEVIAFGTSSGGHLALMAGMLPPKSDIDLPECSDQPKIAAIFDFYGITSMSPLLEPGATLKRSASNWLGQSAADPAFAEKMSPLHYVRPGLPPTFIVHGDADPVVPYTQSIQLRDQLTAAAVPVRMFTVPGGQHGKFTQQQSLEVGEALKQFLRDNHLLPHEAGQ